MATRRRPKLPPDVAEDAKAGRAVRKQFHGGRDKSEPYTLARHNPRVTGMVTEDIHLAACAAISEVLEIGPVEAEQQKQRLHELYGAYHVEQAISKVRYLYGRNDQLDAESLAILSLEMKTGESKEKIAAAKAIADIQDRREQYRRKWGELSDPEEFRAAALEMRRPSPQLVSLIIAAWAGNDERLGPMSYCPEAVYHIIGAVVDRWGDGVLKRYVNRSGSLTDQLDES